jgi:hypothetical protein
VLLFERRLESIGRSDSAISQSFFMGSLDGLYDCAVAEDSAHEIGILGAPIFGLYVVGLAFYLNVRVVTLLHKKSSNIKKNPHQILDAGLDSAR